MVHITLTSRVQKLCHELIFLLYGTVRDFSIYLPGSERNDTYIKIRGTSTQKKRIY